VAASGRVGHRIPSVVDGCPRPRYPDVLDQTRAATGVATPLRRPHGGSRECRRGGGGFHWNLFLVRGDPAAQETYFGGFDKSKVSPISCPDNVAFDGFGNLWISTDGNVLGANDGIFTVPVAARHPRCRACRLCCGGYQVRRTAKPSIW
jgi:uncharacterized protein DUF839